MTNNKTQDRWPLTVKLSSETIESGGWESQRWQVSELLPATEENPQPLSLELHPDERTAYRFNLNSTLPHLFILCDEDEVDGNLTPVHITASQDDAASFMDGEHHLLETPMPPAIQCWIDTYLGIKGELIDCGRKKKKGRGRSSGR